MQTPSNRRGVTTGDSWIDSTLAAPILYYLVEGGPSSVADVTQFGAVGDDDPTRAGTNVAAIQAAIDHVASNGGGVVYVPAGRFRIDRTIYLRSGVSIVGESMESAHILASGTNSEYRMLSGGADEAPWGSFGNLRIENLHIGGDWNGVGEGSGGGIALLHAVHVRLNRVRVDWVSGVAVHLKAIGYSSIEQCSLTAAGRDVIWLESYSASDACTSTQIRGSQVSTGLRSAIHIQDGFNILVDGCQLEDSGTALLMGGNDNRNLTFTHNYVESTRGDYDIDLGAGAIIGFACHDNYLFGTPDVASYRLPPVVPQPNLYIWNNIAATPCRSDVASWECP